MDPLVTAVIAFGFAVLFGTAAMTKLRDFERFRSALRNYALVPSSLEPLVSVMIVFVEIVLAIGWLLGFLVGLEDRRSLASVLRRAQDPAILYSRRSYLVKTIHYYA